MADCYSARMAASSKALGDDLLTSSPFWNKWFSSKFNFRSYTHGKSNSSSKAAYRFSRILRDSAGWLDGSPKTDIDVLLEELEGKDALRQRLPGAERHRRS